MKKSVVLGLGALILTGCASYTNWMPTVDTYNDPNAARIGNDLAECRGLAQQASGGGGAERGVMGALGGGALGAATGAAIGAVVGDPGAGAAIGAAAGGIQGGAYMGMSANEAYKAAYRQCMRNRGHNVLN